MKSFEMKVKPPKRATASRPFVRISIAKYVKVHAASNPGTNVAELSKHLRQLLEAKVEGERCQCGEPIWAIGSAQVGLACFTCITGEAASESDFEVVAGT